jgi:Fe2+ or Zn2+ uptake regulation protein
VIEENILKKKNIKPTSIRIKILSVFLETHSPLSLEDLRHQITADQATIFRNLKLFEDNTILKGIQLNEKKRKYELASSHNHHIICKSCHFIEKLQYCFASSIEEDLTKKGYTSLDHKIIFYGFCKKCS